MALGVLPGTLLLASAPILAIGPSTSGSSPPSGPPAGDLRWPAHAATTAAVPPPTVASSFSPVTLSPSPAATPAKE